MAVNILITAGGTLEPIDRVRSITNTGTGKLGSLIADEFAKYENTGKIFYIHTVNSYVPKTDKAILFPIRSTSDLEKTVKELCCNEKIDIVIHSMAVSDYRVRSVVEASALANKDVDEEELLKLFDREDLNKKYNKLPSRLNSPVILLEPTPKIIPMFREFLPEAEIVGFKLLDNVSHKVLIDTALALLKKNNCNYVLANDYSTVEAGNHIGYLVDDKENETEFTGKQGIAEGIAKTLMKG